MSPRRSRKNQHLAGTNLYYADKNRKYLYYLHPITGKKIPMRGKTEAEAVILANQVNTQIPNESKKYEKDHIPDLLDKFISDYLPLKEYAPRTLQGVITKINKLKIEFLGKRLQEITVLDLKNHLEPFTPHSRKHNRLLWIEIYKYALSEGIVENNLAARTLTKKIPKRQRDRLTMDQYNKIYAISPDWFQIAMDSALLTLQRREDLINIKHEDFDNGILSLIQNKTGTGLKITANTALEKLFKRSMHTDIHSPYLLHKKPIKVRRKYIDMKDHWTQITPEMLTRKFKELRDEVIESTATWYEVKSLGGRMLILQGENIEFVQALMAHGNKATTQIYLDNGITWKQAEAGLKV
ncbi:MAG: tyrosine-type recombinase/integrase [Flavobacteriales bacterium]|nr:tyrosine-type recombinase/integrase [Flavobacteriales bacterium]